MRGRVLIHQHPTTKPPKFWELCCVVLWFCCFVVSGGWLVGWLWLVGWFRGFCIGFAAHADMGNRFTEHADMGNRFASGADMSNRFASHADMGNRLFRHGHRVCRTFADMGIGFAEHADMGIGFAEHTDMGNDDFGTWTWVAQTWAGVMRGTGGRHAQR